LCPHQRLFKPGQCRGTPQLIIDDEHEDKY
jgi:hypothetical protein